MNAKIAQQPELPQLPPSWRSPSAAAEQGDKFEGAGASARRVEASNAIQSFVRKLAADGTRELVKLQEECSKLLGEHNARRERLQQELDREVKSKADANDEKHASALARIRREVGPDSAAFKDAKAQAEDAQKGLRDVRAAVGGRPLRTQMGWWYYLLMAALTLIEVPVNRASFELTFREEPMFSLLLALAVGGVLLYFAHLIGLLLRQWPEHPTKAQITVRAVSFAGLVGLVGSGIYFLARMRQSYMMLVTQENAGFGSRLQDAIQGASGASPQPVSLLANIPFGTGDWMFIAVNALLFTFGVTASFLRHDPHPDYEKMTIKSRKADKHLAKMEGRFEEKVAEEKNRFDTIRRGLDTQMAELKAALTALSDQEFRIKGHMESARRIVAQTIRSRCAAFADSYNEALERGARMASVPSVEEIGREITLEHQPHVA